MSDKPSSVSEAAKSTSSRATRKSTESLSNIEMIGKTSHQIIGAKLPSNKQVLLVTLFTRFNKIYFVLTVQPVACVSHFFVKVTKLIKTEIEARVLR